MRFILEERFILHEEDLLDLSDLPDFEDTEADEVETTIHSGEVDWEKEYSKCNTPEDYKKFWKGIPNAKTLRDAGYYKGAWGKNADKIENLGGYFLTSLTELGWDREDNPFIAFVDDILSNKVGTKLELPTKANNNFLTVIFKAFKDRSLSAEDLRGTGKLKRYNIIFKPNFYTLTLSNQEQYLSLQQKFIEKASELDMPKVWSNIINTKGNIKTFDTIIPLTDDSAFRDIARIKALIEKATGKAIDEPMEATDKNIAMILKQITSEGEAKKAIAYLYDLFGATNYEIVHKVDQANSNSLKLIKNRTTVSAEESDKFRQLFNFKTTKYSATIIEQLLKKLLEKSSTAVIP